MVARRWFLIGFAVAAVGVAGAVGWQLYQWRDLCMTGSEGGSCPVLADVNGIRYAVGGSRELVNVDGNLISYGLIDQTNAPTHFSEMTVYALSGIDPKLVLVAKSTRLVGDAAGPYRLLFAESANTDSAWPAICAYLPDSASARCT